MQIRSTGYIKLHYRCECVCKGLSVSFVGLAVDWQTSQGVPWPCPESAGIGSKFPCDPDETNSIDDGLMHG